LQELGEPIIYLKDCTRASFRKYYILVLKNSLMDYNIDQKIVKEAKRLAEEDYNLVANMLSGVTDKNKYLETRTQHYVKKLLSQGK